MKRRLFTIFALLLVGSAHASLITSDIIFGSGNTNRGFTIETFGDLELALRAKQRYTPNDVLGVGIVQDIDGNYLFDSTGASVPANRSFWNFDWSINSDITDGSTFLSEFQFLMRVDFDPSAGVSFFDYNPLGPSPANYYLGNNSTPNGGGIFTSDTLLLGANNVAQNSVNMGFIPGAPIGAGQFRIELQAMDANGGMIGSTAIDVFVDTTPVSEPAMLGVFAISFGLLAFRTSRRKKFDNAL